MASRPPVYELWNGRAEPSLGEKQRERAQKGRGTCIYAHSSLYIHTHMKGGSFPRRHRFVIASWDRKTGREAGVLCTCIYKHLGEGGENREREKDQREREEPEQSVVAVSVLFCWPAGWEGINEI